MVYTGTSNNIKSISVPLNSLKPSNNNGVEYFMSLYTGERIHSYICEYLPIDDDVIQRMEQMAEIEKQPVIIDSNLFFNGNQVCKY